ncbi:MAG TPA: anti-sigma factor [Pyrinomonadaceae bacterium]
MNCEDARPLIDSFADGELDLVNHVQVETHLEECLACDHAYRDRAALKKALADDDLYFRAPTELRSKIRSALGEATSEPFYKRFFKWRWLPTVAAAAIVVVALFATLAIFRQSNSNDLLANEMVSAHVRSLMDKHLMDVPSTDQHTVKPWFEGKLDFSPPVVDLTQLGFTLIGGRLDYAGGRPIAALVYQRRLHIINVFIYPTQDANAASSTLTRQGFNVVRWTRNGMAFWAVSDINAGELQELATDLQS